MTTEANTETVTVELRVETAYNQLVGFQTAVKAFNEADAADDADGRLSAANAAVDSCLDLINEIIPGDLSDKLHARLAEEHPDLVPAPSFESLDLEALIRMLSGGEG